MVCARQHRSVGARTRVISSFRLIEAMLFSLGWEAHYPGQGIERLKPGQIRCFWHLSR